MGGKPVETGGKFLEIIMSRLAKIIAAAALVSLTVQPLTRVYADDAKDTKPAEARSAAPMGNRGARHVLDHAMPAVKFSETPLNDVLDFLQDTSGANFSVDWKALEAAHVAKDTPITLRMSGDVALRKLLTMVLTQASGAGVLTFHIDQGVIEITTQEADDKILINRIYPIQDLLFTPQDASNAPNLSLQNAAQGQSAGGGSGTGGGGSGSNQSLFQDSGGQNANQQNQANSQKEKADEIIKLITDTVKPELWQVNGGTATITFFHGSLIVNAPRSIHEQLESQ
jgi:hypothetical protein